MAYSHCAHYLLPFVVPLPAALGYIKGSGLEHYQPFSYLYRTVYYTSRAVTRVLPRRPSTGLCLVPGVSYPCSGSMLCMCNSMGGICESYGLPAPAIPWPSSVHVYISWDPRGPGIWGQCPGVLARGDVYLIRHTYTNSQIWGPKWPFLAILGIWPLGGPLSGFKPTLGWGHLAKMTQNDPK